MTDRWEQINRIYDEAVDVEEKNRAAFLEEACGDDSELRREVESLLAYDSQAKRFINQPALQMTAEKLASEPPSLVGRKVGPYQIQGVLGAGGMGEVYKARDTRLNRAVAIKVLPRYLSERADLRQRFEREARVIASLNHPNICALHDIGREEGVDFLVMEYVEGETLSKRLRKGPLPTEQLLRTAVEIATALDQAHRHGMIHRDLKPGNIMLTKKGAKLLDFGLAKQTGGTRAPARVDERAQSARSTRESLTEEGMLLGTLEYMAPEQVKAKETDTRTDIFALGVVIYEMATGRKAFAGDSKASLTAAILTSEPPPITKIQPMTPPALERVVKRCLAKDPEERWQTACDLASELKWVAEVGGAISAAAAEAAAPKPVTARRRREQLAWAMAGVLLIATIVSALSYLRLVRAPAHAIISEILPPEKCQFNIIQGGPPALSPDGRTLAFSAEDERGTTMLWVRSLDSLTTRTLTGTENGTFPFWSADGQKLGFFTLPEGKLKTISMSGGSATVLADVSGWGGGTWNREGTILYVLEPSKGLYQVAASGGPPTPVLEVDRSKCWAYRWPKFLPDGKHFLYQARFYEPALNGIYLASLDGKENQHLLTERIGSTYASGYLLYLRDRTLMAQAFDPERRQLKGDAHPVAEWVIPSDYVGCGLFDVSPNGLLVYGRGVSSREKKRMSWFDRAGKELRVSDEGDYNMMRFSHDGTRLAFNDLPSIGIWVEELARGVRMRVTAGSGGAVWSPDGSRILFSRFTGDRTGGVTQKNSDGTGGEEMLLPAETSDPNIFPNIFPTSWSRDGRFILFVRGSSGAYSQNLWVLPLTGDRKPRLFIQNAFDGHFSPDDRWVAYTSAESGSEQVYAVPFEATKALSATPGTAISLAGKCQISHSGGAIARWRGDGKEIFYRSPGTTGASPGPLKYMWAAEVDGRGKTFKARKAQPLFRVAEWTNTQFDVTPDGKQFVIITQKTIIPNSPLTLVVNWTRYLANNP